jgi:hypothetical protein
VRVLDRQVYWRRRLTALGAVVAPVAVAAAVMGSGDEAERASQARKVPPAPELPRGGRSVFPEHRARPYDRKRRPVLPALELITVIANAHPGDDGMYRGRQEDAVIRRYLRAARRAKGLLLLDIQPGRADFFSETVRLRKWLKEPDVGLALDPEWRVSDGEVPGQVIGHVESREVNATSAWLAQLVKRSNLPEKLFVIHQFTDDMVDHTELKRPDGLAMVLNVDGFGGREVKIAKYRSFAREAKEFIPGFKLFYEEDLNLLAPRDVLRLKPRPQLVVYE